MSPQHSTLVTDLRDVLEAFLQDLGERLSAHQLEDVLEGRKDDLTSRALGTKPEAYTEDRLIEPLLDAASVRPEPQPYGKSGERDRWPDGKITGLDTPVITEHKPLNSVEEAHGQVKGYLDRKSLGADYGIATDGIEWYVYKIELGGDFTEYPLIEEVDLREVLLTIARDLKLVGSTDGDPVDVEAELAAFADVFERDCFEELLSRRAPQRLRDARKRDVEEFYELYIELLFGESDEHSYDTCLVNDISSPREATDHDERLFAITLMNRLLFIKFLETRGVLDDQFLNQRVVDYRSDANEFAGNLYETQIKPLFYKLFNTHPDDRDPKYRHTHEDPDAGEWFTRVPYLNGGLFRENLPNERQFGVNDRTLPVVIEDLIEGTELNLNGRGFDPAILGSVFEKTINHIEQERTQRDIGAYYTPNDVTELIIEQTVDPKIEDLLADAVAEENGTDPEQVERIRASVADMELTEMLRRVEEGQGWFGNADAVERTLSELRELKIIDPACGSGHFLTSAMDEIHRAQVSLLRGLNFGEDPDPEDRYEEKRALALNSIYGVDVDGVAAEIAKLRVWLKIVEENGWERSFGQLPNIDVNITDGNSLVGLPMTGSFDDVDVWSEDVREIEQRRRDYKQADEGDPREMERFLDEEIRPELDREYLEMYSKPVETEIERPEEFDAIRSAIDGENLYPELQMVRVSRADGAAFDADSDDDPGDEEEMLETLGFTVYKKSATLDVQDRESKLKRLDDDEVEDHRAYLEDSLRDLLEGPYVFSEVQRQPLPCDLEDVQGTPFHWMAEFPEVASEENGRHVVDFDVILTNPPYGDLLSEAEKLFVSTYETGGLNEISFQFIERQLQLLDDRGYYGNVTSLRFVYQSDATPVHDLLREDLVDTRIACFGHRPQSVFPNAQARIAIVSGKRDSSTQGTIATSELVLLDDEQREQKLGNIVYEPTEQLTLRDSVGGEGNGYEIMPKVGHNRELLERIAARSDRLLGDVRADEETQYPNYRKRGGGYWLGFAPNNEWGDLTSIEPLYYESELHQKAAFLLVNSNLFYVYWTTYSNFRNFDFGHIDKFPLPEQAVLEDRRDEIFDLADRLWEGMLDNPSNKSDERFDMGGVKPIVDEIERELIGDWFDLSTEQVEYLNDYHTEFGRSQSD